MEYETQKQHGAQKYQNKKKNEGGIGTGRSDEYMSKRGRIKKYDRYTHHSRRQVLDEGVANGAQEAWLPTTTCSQRRAPSRGWRSHAFHGFKKYRYQGEICQLLEKNKRTPEENEIIKELAEIGIEQNIPCKRCQYYYKMLDELPDLDTVENIQDVKEMYRNRNIKTIISK
jgi:hypothetical protein